MFYKIKLTKNKFALVDKNIFQKFYKYSWQATEGGSGFYASKNTWNKKKKKYETLYMHRMIMRAKKGQIIDHKNGNKLDNRRKNLRFCSQSQNLANRRGHGKFKYKGIKKFRKLYGAYIRIKGKEKYLGLFKNITEAAKAYDRAAIKLFKNFAKTNFHRSSYQIKNC